MHSFTNNFLGRCFYSYEYTTPWATLRQQRIWSCKTRFIDNTNYLEWHAKHQQYPLKQLSYLLRCPFSGRIACKIQYSGETYKKKLSKNRSLNFYQRASWKYWPTFLGYNTISNTIPLPSSEKYISKWSLIKHTCSWCDELIVLWTLNRQAQISFLVTLAGI